MADNLELTSILNQLLQRPRPPPTSRAGGTGKSGRDQIRDNARQIRSEATVQSNPAAEQLGLGPCLLSTNSVDGRGRPQKVDESPHHQLLHCNQA
ncbi:MAG: hypothetical protein Q9164_007630 [Protoblastenia rupestris]